MFKKDGPPVLVEVYVGGRARIRAKGYTFRDRALVALVKKGLETRELRVDPGRYYANFKKVGRFHVEAELTPVAE